MLDFLSRLFDSSGFPPRWHCGSWTTGHGWLHILSDIGVWSAYFAIPCILAFFVLRRPNVPFRFVFVLFGAFILACGTTHLMEAIIFWWPVYRLAGVIKLFTALVSWSTVLVLVRIVPRALTMPTPKELEHQIEVRKQVEEELRDTQSQLEQRVREGTEANRRVQASLAEKEVLLKEVHHRVKNNLQIISSLLDLQSAQAVEGPSVEQFRAARNRVRSMALVHERLYRSEDLGKVDFAAYIEGLADQLLQTYRMRPDSVQLKLQVDPGLQLPIDVAVPCALVLNELLTNCLKHAFPADRNGVIRVSLRAGERDLVALTVVDDGIGLPEGVNDLSRARSFGLQLVAMLAGQLKATTVIQRNGGTMVRLTFPLPLPRAVKP